MLLTRFMRICTNQPVSTRMRWDRGYFSWLNWVKLPRFMNPIPLTHYINTFRKPWWMIWEFTKKWLTHMETGPLGCLSMFISYEWGPKLIRWVLEDDYPLGRDFGHSKFAGITLTVLLVQDDLTGRKSQFVVSQKHKFTTWCLNIKMDQKRIKRVTEEHVRSMDPTPFFVVHKRHNCHRHPARPFSFLLQFLICRVFWGQGMSW